MGKLYLLIGCIALAFNFVNAQITIVAPTNGINLDTNFTTLDDIVLYETQAGDFYGTSFSGKMGLLVSDGFELNTSSITYNYSSKPFAIYDIFDVFFDGDGILSIYGKRAFVVGFEFRMNPAAILGDTVVISGLKVRAVDQQPRSGKISRVMTSNDISMPGVIFDSTSFANVSTAGVTGINPATSGKKKLLQISPQPIRESATAVIDTDRPAMNCTMSVFDLSGRAIKSHQISGSQKMVLQRSDFGSSGMYFYQLTAENKQLEAGKIIVE